ncbi:MAG: K+/H+ antiporter subunit F [Dechloromonas sp.]|uniref:K+/H+ antiporter subunit F n=1 Tax=Azonexus hydrophilus TaxID=418702 RepID=A0ABZ2XCU0_9RHOO|nr:K+/H+ antiporter subunit F [Azonexus hydrophilus]MCA1937994.1 K+/H+ antiporter subunit F [Dechloromonas sp.]
MIEYAIYYAYVAISLGLLLNLWRLFKGPGSVDRVLAVDTMVINIIALIIVYGIQTGSTMYFEAALLLAMFGFISTVAYCKFILRGDVIE